MQLPPYAGNLVFMLPVKDEKPSTHTITIKLCQGVSQCKGTKSDVLIMWLMAQLWACTDFAVTRIAFPNTAWFCDGIHEKVRDLVYEPLGGF